MIIPEWVYKEPIENKIKFIYSPKPLKRIAKENNKKVDNLLEKEIAKKLINSFFY